MPNCSEDELNVKSVRALDTSGEAVAYSLNPYPKQLGQKYGSKFPAIRAAILKMDSEKSALNLLSGNSLHVKLDKEDLEILPEEVEVRMIAKEGFAVAAEGAYLAALVTDLTPELEEEGIAREFVRRIQDLRKQADFEIADRIQVVYKASKRLAEAIEHHKEFILGETLSTSIDTGDIPSTYIKADDTFDAETINFGIIKSVKK